MLKKLDTGLREVRRKEAERKEKRETKNSEPIHDDVAKQNKAFAFQA